MLISKTHQLTIRCSFSRYGNVTPLMRARHAADHNISQADILQQINR